MSGCGPFLSRTKHAAVSDMHWGMLDWPKLRPGDTIRVSIGLWTHICPHNSSTSIELFKVRGLSTPIDDVKRSCEH